MSIGKFAKDFYLASTLYDAIDDKDLRAILYTLKEKQADPNILLPNGISPLHLALGNDDPAYALQVTKTILQHGGNPNLRTRDGLTPLHIAAAWGHFELVQLLVCCGADPEVRDCCNAMPIDYAVEHKYINIAQYLHYVAYCGLTFADLQDKPEFDLTLDKIIVKNGISEAEYEVENPTKPSLDLEKLPKVSSTELVENWCSNNLNQHHEDPDSVSECSSLQIPINPQFVNCKPRNYKKPKVMENTLLEFECSSKFKSKRSLTSNNLAISNSFNLNEASVESGVMTLPDDVSDVSLLESSCKDTKRSKETSSDYFTCNEISGSTNILEKNICDDTLSFDESYINTAIPSVYSTDDIDVASQSCNGFIDTPNCNDDSSKSTLQIVEVYKYTDVQEGITLFENRLLVNQQSAAEDSIQSQSSKLTSLPASFNYDTDTLRKELKHHGFCPGPITKTTKRVYLRKLFKMKKAGVECVKQPLVVKSKVYSKELEKALNDPTWLQDLTFYKNLEETVSNEFSNPDMTRRWREGINKSSFTYLLLDPRISNNLPLRRDTLTLEETWRSFISSIFYVGKGKRSRPYAHLYEAVTYWTKNTASTNKKLDHIIDIWKDDSGVVCLHVFQNVIPCEAYTREAAMIKALRIENIDNKKMGDFYGTACTWSSNQQKMLGVLLLYKAMLIFLNEGERQLKPTDIN